MIPHIYVPQRPLADFVDFFWFQEDYVPLGYRRERILPTGAVDLLIQLNDEPLMITDGHIQRLSGCFICGPHSEFFTINTDVPQFMLGVHFKPGGAFPFLGLPASELVNTSIPLDILWGRAAYHLRERVLAATTLKDKFGILEQVLSKHYDQSVIRHPAVIFALQEFKKVDYRRKITDITEQIGFSQQRLGQIFRAEVGLSPKLLHRIQRFYQVLHIIQAAQHIDWSEIALNCGYFDQAHFIHDFQAFSGLNPSTYYAMIGKTHRSVETNEVVSPEVLLQVKP